MPKDTKSSGYNKAPACESRGFGHKKEGENFDTPSTPEPQGKTNKKRLPPQTALRVKNGTRTHDPRNHNPML